MLNVKEDYGSPPVWFLQEQAAAGTPSTITSVSSCNSYSPLNEYSAAGMFFQDEDLISISSLDNGNSDYNTYTAPAAVQDDDEEMFPVPSLYQQQQQQQQQQQHQQLLQQMQHQQHEFRQQVSPTFHELEEHETVLLDSVVKSKIEEIAEALEVQVDGEDDEVRPSPTVVQGTSTLSGGAGTAVVTTTVSTQIHKQQQQQQQSMGPPPPMGTGFFVAPQPESLSTIQNQLHHNQHLAPSFPGWGNPVAPMYAPPPLWSQPHPQVVQQQQQQMTPDPQVQLVHLLILCAQKVAIEDMQRARVILAGLKQLTSPDGTPMERLASYFAEALGARIERKATGSVFKGLVSDNLLDSDDGTQTSMLEAFSAFYDYLPIGKFDHLTMNQVILDSVERERAIHILDLHLWIGTQWPAFLHALANRPGGPPKVKITAIGSAIRDLEETGKKLLECARTLKVDLQYCPLVVSNLLEDFNASMVSLRQGEAFIVNSLSKFHYLLGEEPPTSNSATSMGSGGNSKFNNFLRQIRILAPKVLVMAENDANHNSPIFLHRFSECLKYYSAVFDAMATCMSSPTGRARMERLFAAPKIRNIVACEGRERVERHEGMSDWVRRLEGAGFRPVPLSPRAVNQAKLLLRLYYTNGYTLHNERGYLILGWRHLPLNTVSAWRALS